MTKMIFAAELIMENLCCHYSNKWASVCVHLSSFTMIVLHIHYSSMIIIKYRDQPKKKAELFWGKKKEEERGITTTTATTEGANIAINIVVRATIQRANERKKISERRV